MTLRASLRPALVLFAVFLVGLGLLYPLAVTGIAGVAFPAQAHGSLTYGADGSVAGSELIARNMTDPRYFHPRPSAVGYNASASGGSNLGPTNPLLLERVNASVSAFRAAGVTGPVPAELAMASASGLDPHLSVEAAQAQAPRIAAARSRSADDMRALVLANRIVDPVPFHPEYVNVNALNRALDAP
ncbi:MAG: potassium-transporting ATPase subunit KdpC [Methanospirillum sp.]